MAHGKSLSQRWVGRDSKIKPRGTKQRDRSLSGKARVKARKAQGGRR